MATIITLTPDELKLMLDHHERELAKQVDPAKMTECLQGACNALASASTPQIGR